MNKLNHIAFIMDGNGRWGKRKNKGRNFGHLKGVEVVKKIVRSSIKFKIPIVSFFVFSSENWKRPKKEIFFLFKLIKSYFDEEILKIVNEGIKINILGDQKKLPLKKNNKIIVNLAINYGSKNEILNSCKKVNKKININNFKKNLYTKNMHDPDILIRTGGHRRLSNFMLWQLAYTELYFLKKLWPDFETKDLKKVITDYKKIKRNFGSI